MICDLVQVGVNLDPWNASTASNAENVCDRFFYALTDANFNVLGLALEGPGATPVERYEYTPYGERTVFSHGFMAEDIDFDGRVTNDDVLNANAFLGRSDAEAQVADLDGDGAVTQADVDRVTAAFEKQTPAAAGRDPWVSYAAFHSAPVPYTPSGGVAGSGVSGGRAVGLCEVGHQGLLHDELPGGTLVYNRARMLQPGLGRFLQRDPLGSIDGLNHYQPYLNNANTYVDPDGLKSITLSFKRSRKGRNARGGRTFGSVTVNYDAWCDPETSGHINITSTRARFAHNMFMPNIAVVVGLRAETIARRIRDHAFTEDCPGGKRGHVLKRELQFAAVVRVFGTLGIGVGPASISLGEREISSSVAGRTDVLTISIKCCCP